MLLFLDSFEDRTTTSVINRYDGSANTPTTSTTARTGLQSLSLSGNAAVTKTWSSMGGGGATLIIGVAFYMSSAPTGTNSFIDIFPNVGVDFFITMNTSMQLSANVNGFSSFLAIGTANLSAWNYLQIKVVFSGTSTQVTCVLNNMSIVTGTATNLSSSASAPLKFTLLTSYTMFFDDLCVFDASGTRNNDLPGQPKIENIRPTGAGSNTHLGAVGGSNWNAVADSTPDNDSSYVSSATPGDRDTYQMGNLAATTGYVAGMQINMFARKDDASTRQIAASLHIVGADYDLATVTETTAYQNLTGITEVNPANGLQLTIADVNAMEVGVKVVA